MSLASVTTPRAYAELPTFPRVGATVTLPIGLLYFNEYFGTSHVTKREHVVTIVEVDRDEFYWTKPDGDKCYTRWRRKAA